jgi:hypothetical protein
MLKYATTQLTQSFFARIPRESGSNPVNVPQPFGKRLMQVLSAQRAQ